MWKSTEMDTIYIKSFLVGLCNLQKGLRIVAWKIVSCSKYTQWRTDKQFKKCEHPGLMKKEVKTKDWLSADSDEFKALQKIVTDKKYWMTWNISLDFYTQGFWKFTMPFTTNGPQKVNVTRTLAWSHEVTWQ